MEFFARIDNVFDKQYIANARASNSRNRFQIRYGREFTAAVNPGRVWTAGLSIKF